jgi:hypothetical protein
VPETPTVDNRFLASATVPGVDRVADGVVRAAGAVVEDMDALLTVLVLGEAPLVVEATGRRVAVVDCAVGGLAVFEGEDDVALGTVDVRRAAVEVRVDFFLSSSEAEGWDRWLDRVPAGFFTADPAGGRVGGLAKPDAVLEAVAVDVRDAAVVPVAPAAAGRRRVEVAEPAGRFVAVDPSGLAPLAAFFTVELGDAVATVSAAESAPVSAPVPAVPVVSSPERTDSSCWTTSKPSDSDMMFAKY